jgi:hypothetical protein
MTLLKRRVAAAVAVVGVASLVTFLQVEASHETDDQISAEAVWNPATEDIDEINKSCQHIQPAEYAQCFIDQMGGYASSDAVAFSQLLAEKPSRLGYLQGMREAGLVDLGYVAYPGSTKARQGWVLMNGIPALVNVDDLAILPRSKMETDPQFGALHRSHPQMRLAVTDDQRRSESSPQVVHLADGGQRFIVPYSLQESCDGCSPLGQALFGFDFDATGKFLGVKFVSVSTVRP